MRKKCFRLGESTAFALFFMMFLMFGKKWVLWENPYFYIYGLIWIIFCLLHGYARSLPEGDGVLNRYGSLNFYIRAAVVFWVILNFALWGAVWFSTNTPLDFIVFIIFSLIFGIFLCMTPVSERLLRGMGLSGVLFLLVLLAGYMLESPGRLYLTACLETFLSGILYGAWVGQMILLERRNRLHPPTHPEPIRYSVPENTPWREFHQDICRTTRKIRFSERLGCDFSALWPSLSLSEQEVWAELGSILEQCTGFRAKELLPDDVLCTLVYGRLALKRSGKYSVWEEIRQTFLCPEEVFYPENEWKTFTLVSAVRRIAQWRENPENTLSEREVIAFEKYQEKRKGMRLWIGFILGTCLFFIFLFFLLKT